MTHVSVNKEHAPYIPNLMERRRAEYLAPAAVENRQGGPGDDVQDMAEGKKK